MNITKKRERKKDNDAWEDEKASREAALAEKELAIAIREAVADEKDIKITELNEHIAVLNDKIEEIKESSFKAGKDKAAKNITFKKAILKKKLNGIRKDLKKRFLH